MALRSSRSVGVLVVPAILIAAAGAPRAMGAGPWGPTFYLANIDGTNGILFANTVSGERVGWSIAGGGDLNGDGFADVLIGGRDMNGSAASSGGAYVIYGSPNLGATPLLTPASLNGTNGFKINGINATDDAGTAVAMGGDFNGDNLADLLIGADDAFPFQPGVNNQGEAYLIYGRANLGAGGVLNLSALNGTNGFLLAGVAPGDRAGTSVAFAGDINNDGKDDIAIGAPGTDNGGFADRGSVYLVYGSSTIGASGSLLLSALNGTNGIRLDASDAGDELGTAVGGLGDTDGDGYDDMLAGAPNGNPGVTGGGQAHLIFGGPGIPASSATSVSALGGRELYIQGAADSDHAGSRVAGVGDINGDGFQDFAILASGAGTSGVCYVVFGGAHLSAIPTLEFEFFAPPDGFMFTETSTTPVGLQSDIGPAGDINDDGFDDMIVTARYADSPGNFNNGESFILFGSPTIGASGAFTSGSLNGVNGFRISGAESSDYSGYSCTRAGDVNGDGIDDLALGVIGHDIGTTSFAGAAYIVFGRVGNTWISPASGSWATASRWLGGVAPLAGAVVISPSIGITVTGPSTAVFLDSLTLGAGVGRTTLDLQTSSLISIASPFTIPGDAAITGAGILACEDDLENRGTIELEGMTIAAPENLTNTSSGRLIVAEGFVAATIDNEGLIDIAPRTPFEIAALEVEGKLVNSEQMLLRSGRVDLVASVIHNTGDLDIVLAEATIFGDVSNQPFGGITIAEESSAVFVDDVENDSSITVDTGSSLTILGTLSGNGVSGPGGAGTAGPVFIGAGIAPGQSPGIARFDGDLTIGTEAVSRIEIGGTTPGSGHDQIAVAGVLSVAGTLRVSTLPGFTPAPGHAYKVLDFGSLIGSFSSVQLSATLLAADADASTLLIDGTIRIPAPACPGDVNGDGFTNAADFNILASNFRTTVPPNTMGDLNGDGIVNALDFNILAGDFRCGT